MFKCFISLIFIFVLNFNSTSQSQKKISSLIKSLNNSQFYISHSEKAAFTFKSKAALKLKRIGNSATNQLIQAISDTSKNIMAQLVLCHIFYGKATFAGPKLVTENNTHINHYFLGEEKGDGMIINEIKLGDNYKLFVKPEEVERIKTYWEKLNQTNK